MASQALSIRPAETHTPAGLFTGSTTTPRPRQHLNHAIHMIPTLSQTTPPSACRPKKHRTSSHQEEERTPPRGTSKKDHQEDHLQPDSHHQLPPATTSFHQPRPPKQLLWLVLSAKAEASIDPLRPLTFVPIYLVTT
ncbi:hypothetical protein E4U10_004676 [Claviceps purpurea]|nr:hypothetical protein E4U10_004676 [Claviceps purpurea]